MAVVYSEVSQSDDGTHSASSPPLSASPTPSSSSPVPFLSTSGSRYTPVSMSSDLEGDNARTDIGHHDAEQFKSPVRSGDSAATTSMGATAQSSASAQATKDPKRNDRYDLLSPEQESLGTGAHRPAATKERDVDDTRKFRSVGDPSQTLNRKTTNQTAQPTAGRQQEPPTCSSAREHPAPGVQQVPLIRPKPILRTASTKSVTLVHPSPGGSKSRSSSHASNIAQLEATAEKLSMTSSIEDAIRDLHDEQKRSDSRRSSILAASIGLGLETNTPFTLSRQVSAASSILGTNNAARTGGYSPAGYVSSPNTTVLTSPAPLQAGSFNRSDVTPNSLLSRQGVGKSSARSAKSTTKPSLTDIAEMEPITLNTAALDAADRLQEEPEEEVTLRLPPMEEIDLTSPMDQRNMPWSNSAVDAQEDQYPKQEAHRPSVSSSSTSINEDAQMAFADFDGAHCPPDVDSIAPSIDIDSDEPDTSRPQASRALGPTARPKSYFDPATGQQMLFYPARIPAMLNLPQKLSRHPKSTERQKRASQVLSAIPQANEHPTNWLPEVHPEQLLNPLGSGSDSKPASPGPSGDPLSPLLKEPIPSPWMSDEPPSQLRPNPPPANEEVRKSHVSASLEILESTDKRKSRMSALDGAPPQLRASTFFDLPSEPSPALQLKDGSATATLDGILDASTKAPVSAFTDHIFAGHLGSEVYGHEKKRRSHLKRASTADGLQVKKRSSFFHLRTPSKLSFHSPPKEDRRNTIMASTSTQHRDDFDDERTRLSGSVDGRRGDQEEEDDDQSEEQDYQGPPTTLLAELQMRKKQHNMRTRPLTEAFPNGMHATLLEMDRVAEQERQNRRGKRVNLAWEDPDEAAEESSDEDTPLGLLMAAKHAGTDITAIQAEMNRPLGLVERREQEENEPLSQRRDRLQGRAPALTQRQSMMNLGNQSVLRMIPQPGSPDLGMPNLEAEDEDEGETLGERLRRLRAQDEAENPLPRARPVSRAFSAELLSELGDKFGEEEPDTPEDKQKEKTQPKDEEETLGQRRRRLQAEREAQLKNTGISSVPNSPIPPATLKKRHSLADVLSMNGSKLVLTDPRAAAQRDKEQEAARYQQDQQQKIAALRAAMPNNMSQPNLQHPGGYMAGQFNDGTAGGLAGHTRVMSAYSPQGPAGLTRGGVMGHNHNMSLLSLPPNYVGYGGMQHSPLATGYAAYGAPMQMQMPIQMMQMPVQQPGQQYDMVDRWRQSIVP